MFIFMKYNIKNHDNTIEKALYRLLLWTIMSQDMSTNIKKKNTGEHKIPLS